MANNIVYSISDVTENNLMQVCQDLKNALEGLQGLLAAAYPNRNRAMTGQDLIDLDLATQDEIDGL